MHSCLSMLRRIEPILRISVLTLRSAALRKRAFILLKACSIGLNSGEYCGKKKETGTRRFDGFFYTRHPMSREVVHYYNMTALEGRGEALFDVPNESRPVHSALA